MIAHPDRSVNATILLASASPRRRELIRLLGLPVETTSADIDEIPLPGERAEEMARRLSREKALAALASLRSVTVGLRAHPERTCSPPLSSGAAGVPRDAPEDGDFAWRVAGAERRVRREHIYPELEMGPPASCILLASDTVVSLDGEPLGKPRDAAEARSMLRRLRGRTHQVYTAITLIDLRVASAHRAVLADAGRSPRPGADLGEYAAGPEKHRHLRAGKTPASSNGGLSAVPTITDLACSAVPMRHYTDEEIEAYIASGDPFDKAGAYAIQHDGFSPVENFSQCYANVMGLPLCHVVRSLRGLGVTVPNDVPALCQAHIGYDCPVFEKILTSNE